MTTQLKTLKEELENENRIITNYLEGLSETLAIALLSRKVQQAFNCQDRAVEILKLLKEKIAKRG